MADAICGAKTRAGGLCKSRPMENGRCRMHGGSSTGAPKGNRNAYKFGIYASHLTDDELALADEIELGSVDHELRVTRLRLLRALEAEHASNGEPELEERIERDGAENVTARSELKYKRRDYTAIIDRLTARIESLEKTRIELMKVNGSGDTDDMTKDDTVVLKPDEPIPENPVV